MILKKVKIAGWGNTYDFGVKLLDLREVEAPLVPLQLCTVPDSHGPSVKTTMLCADMKMEEQMHVMGTAEDRHSS
jgi:hypothetical protein